MGAAVTNQPKNPYVIMVAPTFIENWPFDLRKMSFATDIWPITPDQSRRLRRAWELFAGMPLEENETLWLADIGQEIDRRLQQFPQARAFVRLGSRSPKDAGTDLVVDNGRDALELLTTSERVYDDLLAAQALGLTPHLALREPRCIEPWEEWRVFVHNRQVIGASQYFYHKPLPDLTSDSRFANPFAWPQAIDQQTYDARVSGVHFAIDCWLREATRVVPMTCYVVDVLIQHQARVGGNHWVTTLIEVNPWSTMTDPCCFRWEELEHRATSESCVSSGWPLRVRSKVDTWQDVYDHKRVVVPIDDNMRRG